MPLLNLKNKKVLVMGLGLHGGGVGIAKFLAENGAQVTVTDLKNKETLAPSLKKLSGLPIRFVLGEHRGQDFQSADLIIKNPGVPDNSPYLAIAQKNKIPVETDIGLFWELCPSKNIIGITGAKGKSTTTTLIYQMIKTENPEAQIAGNIRVSPFEILGKIGKNTPVVLELSSWQLEGLARHKISPPIACVTNILPDHLNRYQNMEAYAEAKKNIFKFQKSNDYVIMNYDNAILREPSFCLNLKRIYWFSRKEEIGQGAFLRKEHIIFKEKKLEHHIASLTDLKIPGAHNLENVLAAVAVSCAYGIRRTNIRNVLREFHGLDSRLELIRELKGVKYYNDTTATMPDAAIAALQSFTAPIILIAGGADKNLDFKNLAMVIAKKAKYLILLSGTATETLKKAVEKHALDLPITIVHSMAEAVRIAQKQARENDIVLLSPACASFGMFQNEFDRGEQFNQEVYKLK
ncbi:MAG: UDP-N-acetylmuramoyl-L-alanine--D-glutamate ligase [bacterium]|nr:UDP-N-acetylmuramoyl-L-alanine--D-glutamate ligase [bacterium]